MLAFKLLLLLPLAAVIAAPDGDFAGKFRTRVKGWAKCHPAVNEELPPHAEDAVNMCSQLRNRACFSACYLHSVGVMKDKVGSEYDGPKVKEHLDSLMKPEHKDRQATMTEFMTEGKECWNDHKKRGGIIPSMYQDEKNCEEAELVLQCVFRKRDC